MAKTFELVSRDRRIGEAYQLLDHIDRVTTRDVADRPLPVQERLLIKCFDGGLDPRTAARGQAVSPHVLPRGVDLHHFWRCKLDRSEEVLACGLDDQVVVRPQFEEAN